MSICKSPQVAASVAKEINPTFSVVALTGENNPAKGMVGPKTEGTFNEAFWKRQDVIWNALDNVQARRYVDLQATWHGLPLLESGTLSTQCNSEIFLPFKTRTYNDGVDEPQENIAMCTVRNFPHLPLHCIEWAKVNFETKFIASMEAFNKFVQGKEEFFKMIKEMESAHDILDPIKALVKVQLDATGSKLSFAQCVALAFNSFCSHFRQSIQDLVFTHPLDEVDKKTGAKFWSGHKRFPKVAEIKDNELAMQYLFSCSNLYAWALKVQGCSTYEEFLSFVKGSCKLDVPEYTPRKVKTEEDESDKESKGNSGDDTALTLLQAFLQEVDTSALVPVRVTKFEKDDETNHHIAYITHATNLRAFNYNIAKSTQQQVYVERVLFWPCEI